MKICDKCSAPVEDMTITAPHPTKPELDWTINETSVAGADICTYCMVKSFRKQILEILGVEEKESVNEHHAGAPDGVRHAAVTRPWLRPYVLFRQWRANKRNLPHE